MKTNETTNDTSVESMKNQSFGWAIKQLQNGSKVIRANWNGKGMWLKLQVPDENSKMTVPERCIYPLPLEKPHGFSPKHRDRERPN